MYESAFDRQEESVENRDVVNAKGAEPSLVFAQCAKLNDCILIARCDEADERVRQTVEAQKKTKERCDATQARVFSVYWAKAEQKYRGLEEAAETTRRDLQAEIGKRCQFEAENLQLTGNIECSAAALQKVEAKLELLRSNHRQEILSLKADTAAEVERIWTQRTAVLDSKVEHLEYLLRESEQKGATLSAELATWQKQHQQQQPVCRKRERVNAVALSFQTTPVHVEQPRVSLSSLPIPRMLQSPAKRELNAADLHRASPARIFGGTPRRGRPITPRAGRASPNTAALRKDAAIGAAWNSPFGQSRFGAEERKLRSDKSRPASSQPEEGAKSEEVVAEVVQQIAAPTTRAASRGNSRRVAAAKRAPAPTDSAAEPNGAPPSATLARPPRPRQAKRVDDPKDTTSPPHSPKAKTKRRKAPAAIRVASEPVTSERKPPPSRGDSFEEEEEGQAEQARERRNPRRRRGDARSEDPVHRRLAKQGVAENDAGEPKTQRVDASGSKGDANSRKTRGALVASPVRTSCGGKRTRSMAARSEPSGVVDATRQTTKEEVTEEAAVTTKSTRRGRKAPNANRGKKVPQVKCEPDDDEDQQTASSHLKELPTAKKRRVDHAKTNEDCMFNATFREGTPLKARLRKRGGAR